MRVLFLGIFLCFFFNCKKVEYKDKKKHKNHAPKTKIQVNSNEEYLIRNKNKFNYDSYWLVCDYVNKLNTFNISRNNYKDNDTNYPYEYIHIKDWEKQDVYCNSTKFEYRKLRTLKINDSTYYLTSFNTHHYKNNDSIFLAKRNNELKILISKTIIEFCSGIGNYEFKEKVLDILKKDIYLFNKKFNLFDSEGVLLEKNISFNIKTKKVEESKIIKSFANRQYCEYEKNEKGDVNIDAKKCLIEINSNNKDWFFFWKGENMHLTFKGKLKYVLKTQK